MTGPYVPAQCADCDQYAENFCNTSGLCTDCCSKCEDEYECVEEL